LSAFLRLGAAAFLAGFTSSSSSSSSSSSFSTSSSSSSSLSSSLSPLPFFLVALAFLIASITNESISFFRSSRSVSNFFSSSCLIFFAEVFVKSADFRRAVGAQHNNYRQSLSSAFLWTRRT
ncbi:Uncharacterized protein FWK35_00003375, partial [Aphis craccivora]